METVDPGRLANNPEFANPGVAVRPDGSIVVTVVAQMFSFRPDPIEVPANRPVMFRLTSTDVMHGFGIVGTNANAMVIPGYVSQFTVTFKNPGEYIN
jgi:cytochrome c oxidase subunit 2